MKLRTSVLSLLGSALVIASVNAAPLTYMIENQPKSIRWSSSSFPLAYTLDSRAVAAFPDLQAATERAASRWQDVEGSTAALRFSGIETVGAGSDGKISVTLNDELFENSGFIAYTTTWFDSSGVIHEADIQIDTSAVRGSFDLEAVMQHELGHLLGLDHSGIVSSAMFPFIAMDAPTPLDSDDRIGLAAMYPDGSIMGGAFGGSVRSARGGVFAAHVVAVDGNGSAVASALTDRDGRFAFAFVPAGEYTVYAEPLDGPVEAQNFSGIWRESTPVFRTKFAQAAHRVNVGEGTAGDAGELVIDDLPPTLNPRWIGMMGAGNQLSLAPTVTRVRAGETVSIAVGGDGIVSGMTTFEFLNSGLRRVSEFQYGSNYVSATFAISPTVPTSSLVVVVRNGNEVATLSGGLAVTESGDSGGRRRAVRR